MKFYFAMKGDKLFSLVLFFLLATVQIVLVLKPDFSFNYGAEFGRVAESMIKGKGFGNVWGGDTGPTATVNPFPVFIHLLGLVLFDSLLSSFLFIQSLKFISYSVSFYFIIQTLRNSGYTVNTLVSFVIFLIFIFLSFTTNFYFTADLWVNVFLFSSFFYVFIIFSKQPNNRNLVFLLLLCFLAPMINSAIALSIVCVIAYFIINKIMKLNKQDYGQNTKTFFYGLIYNPRLYKSYRQAVLLSVAFLLSVGLWVYRNYIVFDEFIPSKSNMWFEFYLANIVDNNGKLSYSANLQAHPISNSQLLGEISQMENEIEWFKKYEIKGITYRKKHKQDYFKRVLNRAYNAFVFTEDDMDIVNTPYLENLNESDKQTLENSGLIIHDTWINLRIEKDSIRLVLANLELSEKASIYNDWIKASGQFKAKQRKPIFILRALLFALIPTLILLILFLYKNYRENNLYLGVFISYCIYLIPYILVSHQLRYQRPLMVLQVILIIMFINLITKKLQIGNLFFK